MAFVEQNKLDAAREIFEQSLDAARQSGSFYDQAPPLNNLGLVEGLQGNTMAALDCYQRSLAIARKTGDRPNEGLVLGNLGWIAGNIGEYEKARAYTEDYLRITREVGNAFGEPLSLINLSAYAVALQDYRAAEANALLAAQLTRKIGDRSGEAWALTYLGHCYSGAGRGAEARDAYQQAYTIRTEMNQALLAAEPLAGLARAALIEGQLDEAGKMIEGLMERLEAGALEGTDEPLRVYLTAYEVLSQLGDPRAPAVLARGGQFLEARAQNIQDAETRAMFLNNIPAHRQIRALLISAPNRSGDPRGAEPR
jgi:tetratricopeptide (TPR) repeat protein